LQLKFLILSTAIDKFIAYMSDCVVCDADVQRIPSYEEIVRQLEDDEKELDKEEQFEKKYNFRFEEPDAEIVGIACLCGIRPLYDYILSFFIFYSTFAFVLALFYKHIISKLIAVSSCNISKFLTNACINSTLCGFLLSFDLCYMLLYKLFVIGLGLFNHKFFSVLEKFYFMDVFCTFDSEHDVSKYKMAFF